ncbi:GHKL domain-containing protein [Niallia circulans]|jgi:two-component system, sporulation sensor kinase B|uniref:sensor histidine kinase n=1 Tax=Niallia circulans TaxID=1397 RepID=UPI0013D5BCD9|nr:HAMP domain-containing sensor histidine kinase [Niallia circulans]QJX62663.1 GHKL domain-containing protein [Niallia circulans]
MIKKFYTIPFVNKYQVISFFLPFFLLMLFVTFVFYCQYKEWKTNFEKDGEEILTLLSNNASLQMREAKRTDSKQLLQNMINSSDFNKNNSEIKKLMYISVLAENEKQNHIAVISQQNQKIGIHYVDTIADKIMPTYKRTITMHEIQHSNIYKLNKDHYMSSFIPINDKKGQLMGVVGMERKLNDQFYFLKELALQTIFFLLISFIFLFIYIRKWLNKILHPINKMMVGLNEISGGNFDVKMDINDNKELQGLMKNYNEVVDNLASLFYRLTNTAKELGTISKDFQLTTMVEALRQMDNIVDFLKINKELQKAEKMNAVGQLAASVAHEIRNPMTVVKGFLQIFYAKEHMSEEERTYIKLMIEEMNRAETIINDYLSLAKPDVEQSQKVNGRDLANKVIDLMHSYAMMSKGIHFKKNIQQVYIEANNNELKQVLINILKNAIEAMKNGGTITINLYPAKEYGVFEIEDTGIGMTEEEINRLGTAFYSLKEKGTGMGLMVCYQMVEQMKGYIEVQSEKGRGTLFRIFIPLYLSE